MNELKENNTFENRILNIIYKFLSWTGGHCTLQTLEASNLDRQKGQEAILADLGKKIVPFLGAIIRQVKPKVSGFFWMLMEEGLKFIPDGNIQILIPFA